jgi:hypothetical protein
MMKVTGGAPYNGGLTAFFGAILLFAAVGLSASASCRPLQIGSVSLNMPAPPGFCELDESKAPDKRMLAATRGMLTSTTLLAFFADCNQLDQWRSNKLPLLKNIIMVQTETAWSDRRVVADDIKASCADMRANGEKTTSDGFSDVKSRAKTLVKKMDFTGQQFLGVLEETPGSVCYAALINRFKAETGTNVVQITNFATTVVNERLVYIYFFAPYDDATMSKVLADLKMYYARFVEANR